MTDNIQQGLALAKSKFILPSGTYDALRWFVNYVLPAAAALYAGLAIIFDFGGSDKVVGAVGLVVVFLNVLLGKSKANFNDLEVAKNPTPIVGTVQVNTSSPETAVVGLQMDGIDPIQLAGLDTVKLRVNSEGGFDSTSQ